MPRREFLFVPGECYHVYNRGCSRGLIFFEPENYFYFIRELKSRCVTWNVEVLAWCLMPNHFHLQVRPLQEGFSQMMQSFSTCYTKSINSRTGRTGTLFEGRFQAIEVTTIEYMIHLSRYLHLNPVNANLVARPEDWEFSSYRDYIGLRKGTLANPAPIQNEFPDVARYRQFVESGISASDPVLKTLVFDDD